MKKMNFYTQNGWAGSNYDSKLQTKDIAAKVREYAKKNFPAFKFSITSRWSMYTDSLYIVLKSGPCIPFVEGSRLANRGHFETMSSVKSWEKDGLAPEVFAAMDGVTSYAASFRYDDSDGMQDYFDTNFFLKIEIDDDYKVIEPKAKKAKEAKKEEAAPVETASVDGLEIVDYSEKAIAVFGETKDIKDELKTLGGKFNPALRYKDGKRAGWIFSKKQADKVRALLAPSTESSNEITELVDECEKEFGEMIEDTFFNESEDIKPDEVAEPFRSKESQKELPANVELYEKKLTGQRYTVKNKPDRLGYFHIVDNLDNSACDFYPNKMEAEHRAVYLNSLIDEKGHIRTL